MFQQTPVLFQLAPLVGLSETVDKVSVKSHLNSDANNIRQIMSISSRSAVNDDL